MDADETLVAKSLTSSGKSGGPVNQSARPTLSWGGRSSSAVGAAQTGTGRSVRKAFRARLSRLFTVPTGIPMASAISS